MTRIYAAVLGALSLALICAPVAGAAKRPATRDVLVVSNNWDGTADFIDTKTFKRVKRLNIVPDKAEREAELEASPFDYGY